MNIPDYFISGARRLFLFICFFANTAEATVATPSAAAIMQQPTSLLQVPAATVFFEQNTGQFDAGIRFRMRARDYQLLLARDSASFLLNDGSRLDLNLQGSGGAGRISAENRLVGISRYFIGPPSQWHPHSDHFRAVRQQQVYPGIDLLYYANDTNTLEYDFIVAAGADPTQIRYRLNGARDVRLDQAGNLIIYSTQGKFIHHAPVVYQIVHEQRQTVSSSFVLQADNTVSFRLARYDHHEPLIIDPGITYASYQGGSGNDAGYAMTRDADGNVYVTGQTDSSDFPVEAGNGSTPDGHDIFVSKFSAAGDLLFTVFLGTTDTIFDSYEAGRGIALDADGRIYVTGSISRVQPGPGTAGAYNACPAASSFDAFLAVLATDGSLDYFTCLGGGLGDGGEAVRLDASGNVYIAGWTASSDFPVRNAFENDPSDSNYDAFIAELQPQGNGTGDLLFASYFGGNGKDQAYDMALAGNDRAYLAGVSFSDDLPDRDNTLSGWHDGFVAAIDLQHRAMLYSRYLGIDDSASGCGGVLDAVYSVAVDTNDDVYLAGSWGGNSALVTKLNGGNGMQDYQTLISSATAGTCSSAAGRAVTVDNSGRAYVAGVTDIGSLTGSNIVAGNDYSGGQDGFVTRVDADGNVLYTTYLGGSGDDALYGAVASANGELDVVGETTSTSVDFPATDGSDNHGGSDVMRARVGAYVNLAVSVTDDGPAINGNPLQYSVLVNNAGPDPASNVVVTLQLPAGVELQVVDSGCTEIADHLVDCQLSEQAAGDMTWFNFTTLVNDNTALTADASVTADQFDYDSSDNSFSHTTAQGADVPTLNVGGGQQNSASSSGAGLDGPWELLALLMLWRYRARRRPSKV